MGRPTVRTDYLLRDDAVRIKSLFGTVANGFRLLGLDGKVPQSEFRRAVTFESIKPTHKSAIEDAWDAWRSRFLKDENCTNFELDETDEIDE